MKEPKPEDFGLSSNYDEIYRKQYDEVKQAMARYVQARAEQANAVKCLCVVGVLLLVIMFITLGVGGVISGGWAGAGACVSVGAGIWCWYAWKKHEDRNYREAMALAHEKYVNGTLEWQIKKYRKAKEEYKKYLEEKQSLYALRTRTRWIHMGGFEFEREVAELYRRLGYKATVTQATGDGGVDVILIKDGMRIAMQCKHHSTPVGPKDIRELQGVVLTQDYDGGIFVSLNGFTPGALNATESGGGKVEISLVDLNTLLRLAGEAEEEFEALHDDEECEEEDGGETAAKLDTYLKQLQECEEEDDMEIAEETGREDISDSEHTPSVADLLSEAAFSDEDFEPFAASEGDDNASTESDAGEGSGSDEKSVREVINEYESMFGQLMDEEFFAVIQKTDPWFKLTLGEKLPVPPKEVPPVEEMTVVCRRIFALIFGSFGFDKDLDKAEKMCSHSLKYLDATEPRKKGTPEADAWLTAYGHMEILYGTVCAYAGRTAESVYHFMNGLGTDAVAINGMYSDFIRHTINKLADLPCGEAEYAGRGFSANDPMGYKPSGNASLNARAALDVIPAMKGVNGEVIVAKCFHIPHPFGSLRRCSVDSDQPHIIDAYEAYIIDKDFNLKKASFYFNGYAPREDRFTILLPEGFEIPNYSAVRRWYTFTEADAR